MRPPVGECPRTVIVAATVAETVPGCGSFLRGMVTSLGGACWPVAGASAARQAGGRRCLRGLRRLSGDSSLRSSGQLRVAAPARLGSASGLSAPRALAVPALLRWASDLQLII